MTLLDVMSWWHWLVGGVGLAGAVALVVVLAAGAPALAVVLGQRLAKLVGELLGTTIGLVLVVGLACFFAGSIWTGWQAAATCEARMQATEQAARDAADARDREIRDEVRREYDAELSKLEKEAIGRDKEIKDYEQKLAAAKTPGCKLGADALRLRQRK